MPPPPSQQGKFKPKKPKPKKKIKAGAASAASAAAAEPKGTVSFAPSAYSGGRGRGEGRGGRGRGRGGRGRGRMPMPTGKVFFTGGEKKKAGAAAGGKKLATAAARRKEAANAARGNNDSASTEEVVGQLDVAIGSANALGGDSGKGSILDSMDYEDQEGELFRPAGAAQGNLSLEGFMYDTDSSEEEASSRRKKSGETIMPPLQLPLKDANAESSQGGDSKPHQSTVLPEPVTSDPSSSSTSKTESSVRSSPFAYLADGEAKPQDPWFLVQLPTRLPPLRQKADENDAAGMDLDEEGEREQVTNSEEPVSAFSDVVTHPVVPGGFDNALLSAAPGRIGKMVVYKSGKTVLLMEGNDGSVLELNVAEGLTCNFLQQAVAIDSEKNTYTELGEVGKSVVVSPVLDHTHH